MNSAKLKARVESMNAYLTAIRFPAVVSSYARVCTTDECRYRLWGITVAPRIPIAMYSFAGSARMEARGTKPPATAPRSGREMKISNRKQPAMVAISATTRASSNRNPLFCRNRTISTSRAVIAMPHARGMPNSRLSPIAEPITSARSHAAIATAQHPQGERGGARVVIAARLRQIAPGHDAEFRGQPLQQDRHQVGQQDDRKQRVPEARAAREIGGPVAGIHVPHGHEVARSSERQRLAPPRTRADGNGAIDFGEARRETRAPPSRLRYGERKIALWRRHQ